MPAYDEDVIQLRQDDPKITYSEIAGTLGITQDQVKHALHRHRMKTEIPEERDLHSEIYAWLNKGTTIDDLCKHCSVSPRVLQALIDDLKDDGALIDEENGKLKLRNIVIPEEENKHDAKWKGNKIIRFGLCGDKQFNSKYTQITHMNTLYDVYEREGIEDVYDLGDVDEGEQMRKGHQYECYNQGADDHVDEIVKNHPYRKRIKTYFITGNHDHSIIKLSGYDIGIAIAKQREDMVYLGQSFATIALTPNCMLELRHPLDGTAYAISYKIQKMVEAISGGEKPNILAVGHYHKVEYLNYRNVHCFQTGCLQGQTPWMRGKGISAAMGGWIIEVEVDSEGTIVRIKMEFIPFYYAIKDDYINWR